MKEKIPNKHAGPPATLSRRELLCAAAAAGGVMIASDCGAGGVAAQQTACSDPQLQDAMRKYGGEFGQLGKGDSHGDL